MSTIRAWLLVGGLVLLGAGGCTEPSVIEQPSTKTAKKDAGRPRKKDAGLDTQVGSSTGDDDDGAGDDGEADDGAGDDSKGAEGTSEDGADDDVTSVEGDVGRAKDAGSSKDAGRAKDAGGGGGAIDKPAVCPGAYMCQDPATALKSFGAEGTVTDADDKPIALACSKGAQETCDPKDPKKSCPDLPNAFCAHVVLSAPVAIDLYNCAQLCTP